MTGGLQTMTISTFRVSVI